MYKDKYKKYVDTNFAPRDDFEKLCKKLEVTDMKSNKGLKIGLGFLASAVVIGGAVIGFTSIGKGGAKVGAPDKLVTLSLDNSNMTNLASTNKDKSTISLTVDKNDKVVSIYGDDELAKLVLVDEKLVGKDVDTALKTILDIQINTGLIVSGNVSMSSNALEISVSAELSDEAEQYLANLKQTVEDKLSKENIKATVSEVKSLVLNEIKEEVKSIDPSLDVDNMTYEDMLKVISIHQIETASLYSEKLEDLYYDVKDYEIEFTEKEVTKEVVNGLEDTYQELKAAYSALIDQFDVAIDALNNAKYNAFVKSDSTYQVELAKLNKAKIDLINTKKTIDVEDLGQVIEFNAKKKALEIAIASLETAEGIASSAIDAVAATLKEVQTNLKKLEDSLPNSIKDQINEQLVKEEAKMNELKKQVFNDFETEHKEDIKKAKQDLIDLKQDLINGIIEA